MEQKLKFIIDAQDRTKTAMKSVQGNMDKLQGKMKRIRPSLDRIAKGFVLAGAAMTVAIGVKAIKEAVKFEKAMASVATLIDTSSENMVKMGKKVKEIAQRIPKDIEDLTAALYDVRSAGISAADAMDVLETSGRLAVAGLATTQEATNLLTSAINVYGDESHDANAIAEILFKTVKFGKTTIAGLAQGFGKVAAIAKETGISIEDLSAATAVLTITGITAAESQTALKAMISNVLKPTTDATEAAERLGISFNLGALEAEGLAAMLVEIAEKAGDDKQALADLFGSVEAANAVFSLTSKKGGAALKNILDDMTESSGALDEAFQKQNATTEAQYILLKNKLNVELMDLGTKVLPFVGRAMSTLSEMIDTAQWLYGLWANKITATSGAMTQLEVKIMTYMETFKSVVRILKEIAEWAEKVTMAIPKAAMWLTEKTSGLKGMLDFQKGGVVPGAIGQPVPAIVHGGETIIPAGAGARGVTININGGTYLSEDAAEEIGDMIIDRLKTNMKL